MQPMHALALAIVVFLLVLFIFFSFILPLLWKYILKPLGKIAYFLLLLIIGISGAVIFTLGKEYGIPESVQSALTVFSVLGSGIKWAKTKYNLRKTSVDS